MTRTSISLTDDDLRIIKFLKKRVWIDKPIGVPVSMTTSLVVRLALHHYHQSITNVTRQAENVKQNNNNC